MRHCVPIMGIRSISHSAIVELMKEFSVEENGVVGYSAAGGLKVVVNLPEEELGLVRDFLLSKGESNEEATARTYNQGIEWYGVVDGAHVHTALMNLHDCRPDPFMDFYCIVTVIKWHPIEKLRAFGSASARNALHSSNVTEMTIFDILQAMHDIANKKARLSGHTLEDMLKLRGKIKEVADEYSGGSHYSRETIRTLAGAALRIKLEAVRTLGTIMNESDMELSTKILAKVTEGSPEDRVIDDRAYRHIISTNTLRGASAFLKAEGVDQSNALQRLTNAFEDNGSNAFRQSKETERCEKARHQISLMKDLMGRDSWPQQMMDVKKKLLLSSVFDSELDESDPAQDHIIQNLIDMYRLKMPLEAGIRCALYCRERNTDSAALSIAESDGSSSNPLSNDGESYTLDASADAEDTATDQHSRCSLEELGVRCHIMTLEKFSVSRGAEEEKFHLVLGDLSEIHLKGTCKKKINERRADKALEILKSLVHPHGWVFFYTRSVDYHMWDKAFKKNDFDPLQFAWPMVCNCDTVQTNTSAIPQNVTLLMIGARKKTTCGSTSYFQPNITAEYERNVCFRKRKFAVMDCCTEATIKLKKRNTREPMRKNERSSEPIAEFLRTFCHQQGNVLDAFAGTMETAKACILTSRRCTALEADRECYDLSIERLKESATAYLESSMGMIDISTNETEETETTHIDADTGQNIGGDILQASSDQGTVFDDYP